MRMMTRTRKWAGLGAVALLLAACNSSTDVEVDPKVEPFVGTWDAVVFTVIGDDPPHTEVDVLVSLGAFWISVEPSGTYTATLEFPNIPPEIGKLTVESSSQLTLRPNNRPPAPSTYVFATPDSLVLDGPTEFDFNLDFTPEPAQAHIELVRRDED